LLVDDIDELKTTFWEYDDFGGNNNFTVVDQWVYKISGTCGIIDSLKHHESWYSN